MTHSTARESSIRREIVAATLCGLALLSFAGCRERSESAVRPSTQPLERLDTPEARRRLASAPSALPENLNASEAEIMCGEVIRLSERGRLILDRSNPRRLVINPGLWSQLPEEGRQALVRCVELMRPPEARNERMAVVAGS